MAFQIKDETAGVNILYIDNSGQLGFGSLPNSGYAITIHGVSLVNVSGNFACGVMPAGAQAGYEGSVFAPGGGTATVSVVTSQIPTVTSTLDPSSVTTTTVSFDNTGGPSATINYAIW